MAEKETNLNRMKELVDKLTLASKAYYAQDTEIMSNFEYDRLYDELMTLEQETGVVLVGSPTANVGYEAVDELQKERHEFPMLSLGKTKDKEELKDWLQEETAILSWKLDGLTVVLTYRDGRLYKAVTRGNGEIGEVVTNNVRTFTNIPLAIPYTGELIIRGEAIITYSDFEKINEEIAETDAKYKNPRNLCSGSVRQLNNEITAARHVKFYAFALVKAEGCEFDNSREKQFLFLQDQGFAVVEYRMTDRDHLFEVIEEFAHKASDYDLPSDGLVLVLENISYGLSLGSTSKFPRDSIAFKWEDEVRETVLTEIEWSPSRTGLINPVAIFEPVELEGTTVSRASVHNISILNGLKLGIGDRITVYKANMIIPQIADNLTGSGTVEIPNTCPACGGEAKVRQVNEVQSLYCMNPECEVKKSKSFALFVSRDAMNIEGVSQATLEKLMERGLIREYADLFHLEEHRDILVEMEGFGEKSYQNLIACTQKARDVTLPRLIYSLGIANIGLANAKMICKYYKYDIEAMLLADTESLSEIDGVGGVIAAAFCDYFGKEENREKFRRLLAEVRLIQEEIDEESLILDGKVIVVTGSLNHFAGRSALKELIERLGGKVTGSVTSKTDCLINNEAGSASSKNKKAKELEIPILTEEEFIEQFLGGNDYAD